jgi:hypothetical protein
VNSKITLPASVWALFLREMTVDGVETWDVEYCGTRAEVEDHESMLLAEFPDMRLACAEYFSQEKE